MQRRAEDIILVCGIVKTSAWFVAALRSGSRETHEFSFDATASHFAGVKLSTSMELSVSYSLEHRIGPQRRPPTDSTPASAADPANMAEHTPPINDQCIFVSYYKIKYRHKWLPPTICANADPHDLSRDRDDDDSDDVVTDDRESVEAQPNVLSESVSAPLFSVIPPAYSRCLCSRGQHWKLHWTIYSKCVA